MNPQFPFRRFYSIFCFLVVVLLSTDSASAQQWKLCNGPFGGDISCFANSGTDLYAGTYYGGIFLTTNNGQSWRPVNNGLTNTNISSIAILGTKIFAGTSGDGLFVSTNKGDSWEKDYSLKNSYVYGLYVSESRIFIIVDNGAQFSDDYGKSWTLIQPALYASSFSTSENYIYASVPKRGVYRSSNNGTTWTAINSGLTNLEVDNVYANGANIYAVVRELGGIFVSHDYGNSWKESKTGLPKYPSINSISSIGNTIFIGLYDDGVFKSIDNGSSWSQVSKGLDSSWVSDLIAVGSNLFAGCSRSGVFLSTNNGSSWKQVNNGITNIRAYPLAANGSTLYASTEILGLAQTKDEGETWTSMNLDIKQHPNFSPYPSSLYPIAITTFGENIIVGTQGNGLYVSKDNGTTWTESTKGLPLADTSFTSYSSFAVIGSTIFVGTDREGIFRSTDTCNSWIQVNKGITNLSVSCFASIGTKLFAATARGGIFVSSDFGENWKSANNGMGNATAYCMTSIGSKLFVGTQYYGVFQSIDNGENWTNVKDPYKLFKYETFSSFAVVNNSLFASTENGSILVTEDLGNSWYRLTMGMTKLYIYSLAVCGSKIFAGTSGSGIWKKNITYYMDVHEKENTSPNPALQIYPNPANNSITIDNSSPLSNSTNPIQYTITSLTGEMLLETESAEPQCTISTEFLGNGVYYLTARQGLQRSSTLFSILH